MLHKVSAIFLSAVLMACTSTPVLKSTDISSGPAKPTDDLASNDVMSTEEKAPQILSLQTAAQTEALEFTGRIENTDIAVALHIDGSTALAYVCGGDKTWDSVTGWLKGTLTDEQTSLVLKGKNGRQLSLTLPDAYITAPPQAITAPPQALRPVNDAKAEGLLSQGLYASTQPVSLEFTGADNASGLYRQQKDNQDIGVIVTNDGYAVGVVMDNDTKEPKVQAQLVKPLTHTQCIEVKAAEQFFLLPALRSPQACD